jgi:hypothetical protein
MIDFVESEGIEMVAVIVLMMMMMVVMKMMSKMVA